jgi:metallo-beta-lactamase class B
MNHFAFLLVLASAALPSARPQPADFMNPFPPHKVIANIYYVGSEGLASYLITTPDGHILINSSYDDSVPLIRASVEKLGFKFGDIKILLGSHAHGDHMAGHFRVKEATAARILVMQGDEDVIRSGGRGRNWRGVPVDKVMRDNEKITLGGTAVVARHTPGHTKGCTTFTMAVTEGGRKYNVVIVGSPNVNPGYVLVGNQEYPQIAEDYTKSFEIWKSLPCDVFLGAHGNYYDMAAKYKRNLKDPQQNAFIDPAGYKVYIEEREQAFRSELDRQRKGGGPAPRKKNE